MNDFQKKFGNPEITTYEESKEIFNFVGMTSEDIFYDLGCGYGTVCIAAAETHMPKKIIGVEARVENFLEATNRILEKDLEGKIILRNEFLENVDFSDATLIYYSVQPSLNHLSHIKKMIRKGCKIITPKIPLPSIIPTKEMSVQGSRFFLMEGPLEEHIAKNSNEWAKTITKYSDSGIDGLFKTENNSNWLKELLEKFYPK